MEGLRKVRHRFEFLGVDIHQDFSSEVHDLDSAIWHGNRAHRASALNRASIVVILQGSGKVQGLNLDCAKMEIDGFNILSVIDLL